MNMIYGLRVVALAVTIILPYYRQWAKWDQNSSFELRIEEQELISQRILGVKLVVYDGHKSLEVLKLVLLLGMYLTTSISAF